MRRKTEKSSRRGRNGKKEVTVGDGRARLKILSVILSLTHTHFLSFFVDVSKTQLTSLSTTAEDNSPSHEK